MKLAGSAVQAGGQRKQGQRDEITAEENARLANYQADDALNRGVMDEASYRRQLAMMMGKQANEIGARNVERRGSALRLLEDSAQIGAEDITTIRNNAARQAWGYRNQASEASRFGANQSANANSLAMSSLLTGAANAYGSWKKS